MTLTQFIVGKFNQEADLSDKVKVTLGTLFDTSLSTLFTVQGIVSMFDLSNKSVWAYLAIILCSIGYFHLFRLWHITRMLRGVEYVPPQQKPDAEG